MILSQLLNSNWSFLQLLPGWLAKNKINIAGVLPWVLRVNMKPPSHLALTPAVLLGQFIFWRPNWKRVLSVPSLKLLPLIQEGGAQAPLSQKKGGHTNIHHQSFHTVHSCYKCNMALSIPLTLLYNIAIEMPITRGRTRRPKLFWQHVPSVGNHSSVNEGEKNKTFSEMICVVFVCGNQGEVCLTSVKVNVVNFVNTLYTWFVPLPVCRFSTM